jgi:hypothetical protein
MSTKTVVLVLSLGIAAPLSARAESSLVRFDRGVGVIPIAFSAQPRVPEANVVLGVQPARFPWVIDRLRADVKVDGRISLEGRGLLHAGGNNFGNSRAMGGGTRSVRARLFCGGAAHDSGLVALSPEGDFAIDGVLAPLPPMTCLDPVLLIVDGPTGNWLAGGIPKR